MLLLALRLHLDVGCMDLSEEDLLRLQAAQFAQLFLQPHVLFIHVQPQAVTYRGGALQFYHCKSSSTRHQFSFPFPNVGLKHSTLPRSILTGDLQVHVAVHGQGQRQEVEGVEPGADMSARLALHLGLELTVEEIHNNGAVPPQVVLPGLQDERGGQRLAWESSNTLSRQLLLLLHFLR